jgi:hypothetical protein
MDADPFEALFKGGLELDRHDPKDERVVSAFELQGKGLLDVQELEFVQCVNPLDRDQAYLRDPCCNGRIFIRAEQDEHDERYHCPDCDRTVFPSSKARTWAMFVNPIWERCRQFVDAMIKEVEGNATERPIGLWSVLGERTAARVCLVDLCEDLPSLVLEAERSGRVLFVLGNDRDLRPRLPGGGHVFRLAELSLRSRKPFANALRGLLTASPATLPAAYQLAPQPPPVLVQERKRAALFNLGPKQDWRDVTIAFKNGEAVSIRVEDTRPVVVTAEALGLSNARSTAPKKAWGLLVKLCEGSGFVGIKELGDVDREQRQVSSLRAALKQAFNTDLDPLRFRAKLGLYSAFHATDREVGADGKLGQDVRERAAKSRA